MSRHAQSGPVSVAASSIAVGAVTVFCAAVAGVLLTAWPLLVIIMCVALIVAYATVIHLTTPPPADQPTPGRDRRHRKE